MKKISKIIAIAVCILLAMTVLIACAAQDNVATDAKTKTITVAVTDKDGSTEEIRIDTNAATLREALEENNLVSGTEYDVGLLLETVNGITADAANEEWWCLYKDGETSQYGADNTEISDGDHYELVLTVGYDQFG